MAIPPRYATECSRELSDYLLADIERDLTGANFDDSILARSSCQPASICGQRYAGIAVGMATNIAAPSDGILRPPGLNNNPEIDITDLVAKIVKGPTFHAGFIYGRKRIRNHILKGAASAVARPRRHRSHRSRRAGTHATHH